MNGSGNWLSEDAEGLILLVLAQPKASRSETAGIHDDRLKIRLKAPPVDGAANKELISFLSKTLRIPKREITISSGQSSRRKTVRLKGTDADSARRILSSD